MAGIPYYFIENSISMFPDIANSSKKTIFMFPTNFEGIPEKDNFHAPGRKFCIRITEEQARELESMGINVKTTKENPEKVYNEPFVPKHYITVRMKYKFEGGWRNPKVYLVSGDNPPVEYGPENFKNLDDMYETIDEIKVKLNVYKHDKGYSLYVDVMYLIQHQEQDPWYRAYHPVHDNITDPDELPF